MAPTEDKEKSFAPTKEGCVYGIYYDTEEESWWLAEDRIARMQAQVREVLESKEVEASKLWSLTGKVLHVKELIVGGKYHLYHLLKANSKYTEKQDAHMMVKINDLLKKELWWWWMMITMSSHRTKYPDPDEQLPAWAMVGYTDAAGGSSLTLGSGCGAVLEDWWSYIPWGKVINGGDKTEDGKRIGRKFSALELVGPLCTCLWGSTHGQGPGTKDHGGQCW